MIWDQKVQWTPFRRQEGQGLVEYALVISLVAVLIIASLIAVGGQLVASYEWITSQVDAIS